MAYTKQTWTTGDTITASKLNHMEDGIAEGGGGGALIVTEVDSTLDKTFAEIYNALSSGTPAYVSYINETSGPDIDYQCMTLLSSIFMARKYDNDYAVYARTYYEGQVSGDYYCCSPAVITYHASGVNAYPVFQRTVYPTNVSNND